MSENNADFRKEVISYFRLNVYHNENEFLEWIPRNKARILDLMKERYNDHSIVELEQIMDDYYSKL
ncbi:hypothetical protein DSAG12_03299 [Promethearchaeum syntrophicum]|uniref:Uncharacterized protein n=1 Tax=Promethearchaeum syntrophicum TaxID=2594042 RepID=A0A5B9DEE2_9ARCH|nr:hypothetical protein [Candidatus Prometheoarchaeum syntrophicum]QEE17462.1 hypothetical protein DSAG12_03299 [Candidatus Prometheoarchaeum syntrophicum]